METVLVAGKGLFLFVLALHLFLVMLALLTVKETEKLMSNPECDHEPILCSDSSRCRRCFSIIYWSKDHEQYFSTKQYRNQLKQRK